MFIKFIFQTRLVTHLLDGIIALEIIGTQKTFRRSKRIERHLGQLGGEIELISPIVFEFLAGSFSGR